MRESKFTIFITITLAIFTLLLGISYYKDHLKLKKEEKEKAIFEKKIITDRIQKIILYNPSKIELVKNEGFWFVYPIGDIAYSYMVENIISNIYQPAVSEVIDFNQYYNQFFKNPVNLYFIYGNEVYHLQKGIRNEFTNETYLWIDLPEFKDKIYIVNYWDFNYLDKKADEFRMKKVFNISQEDLEKLVVNSNVIYKEEVKTKQKKGKKDKEDKQYYWKMDNNEFASKEYINSLFAFLNNFDFEKSIDVYKTGFENNFKKLYEIEIFHKNNKYIVEVFDYDKDHCLVKCSYRKPLLVYNKRYVNEFANKDIKERKIFSYFIEKIDPADFLAISDSRAKFSFRKKDNEWFSNKNEDKTSQVNLLFNIIKNQEYKEVFLTNPLNTKYELYTFELKSLKKDRLVFYLYNPDYLVYGNKIYKIDSFVFALKELLK